MKKVLAMAAVAALAAGASVYAANPFSDVSTSDWAYQAVSDLSDQGVVEGYPDGTFKGQNNVTRYEVAQIVARLLAKEDQLNAEQRATVDKLAGEYADELDTLGVRVSKLEKQVGNLSFSGDARVRYQDLSEKGAADGYNGRVRLNVKGQVNDNTTVVGRLTNNFDFKTSDASSTVMDQIYVNHNFGDVASVRLGRFPLAFGNQGGWLYNTTDGLDGAEVAFNVAKGVKVSAGYGQFNAVEKRYKDGFKEDGQGGYEAVAGVDTYDVFYAQANADLGVAGLNLNYVKTTEEGLNLFGAGLTVPVGDFQVFGEYWKNNDASDYDTAWNAGLAYGKADYKKAGNFTLSAAYNDVDQGVYFGGSGLQTDVLNYGFAENLYAKDTTAASGYKKTAAGLNAKNLTFWNVIGEVTLAKNTFLHAEYAFDVSAEGAADPDDAWNVSLNYLF